jgi:hypothetical protein
MLVRGSRRREELWQHRRHCGDVLSVQGVIVIGMAAQHQGWPHSTGDGRTVSGMVDKTSPRNPCRGTVRRVHSVAVRTLFEGASTSTLFEGASASTLSPMPFRGVRRGGGRELAVQCHGMTLTCPHRAAQYLHSVRDGCTVTGFGRTVTGPDAQSPGWCQRRGMGGDLLFDYGAYGQAFNALVGWNGRGLERGRDSLEGRLVPRARRSFNQGALVPRVRRR